MYVCFCISMHMYVCAHGDSLMSDISLNHALPYFMRQTFSLNVEFTPQLDWLARKLQGSSCLYHHSARLEATTTTYGIIHVLRQNSDLCACYSVDTFLTKPPISLGSWGD